MSSTTTVATRNMVWIPSGRFAMGCEQFYPEEAPVHEVTLDGFWIDEHPVTVAEFRRFVKATGHQTVAERTPDAADYPGADPQLLVPGSLVFRATNGPVDLRDFRNWWHWTPGASWRHPTGPGSVTGGLDRHPVTHVAYHDAVAYAAWAGKQLPTEEQWEYAARGGLDGAVYAWGDEFAPNGRQMANTWQGQFPWQNLLLDGYSRTSPVKKFPANGYGLYDVCGNVWEWTCDQAASSAASDRPCCVPDNPRAESPQQSAIVAQQIPRQMIKGGSHICAPNYCLRYRPAARQAEAIDTSTSHLGFRCVVRPEHT
jgi:sulfatase modifying factor 1